MTEEDISEVFLSRSVRIVARRPLVTSMPMTGADHSLGQQTDTGDEPGVLVVGGTGHVGAALCRFLSSHGYLVTATSRSEEPTFGDPRIQHLQLDVLSGQGVEHLPTSLTAVICPWVEQASDAASPPWVGPLVRSFVDLGVRSLIYISSVWVYGGDPEGLLDESTPLAPTSGYGLAHARNETALAESADEHGVGVSILRMANLVGSDPFFRFRTKVSFVHELMEMALYEQLIVLKSQPSTPRNLLPRALFHHHMKALLKRQVVEPRVDVFNIGGGSTSTIGGLARTVGATAESYHGTKVVIEHPEDSNPKPQFFLDTNRIQSLSGPGIEDLDYELSMILEDLVANRRPETGRRGPT